MDYYGMRNNLGLKWDEAFSARYSMIALAGEYTRLTRSGSEYLGRCPFPDHPDHHPSFYVNEQKGVFLCRGCGRSGNTISFLQQMYGMGYDDARLQLHHGGSLANPDPIVLNEDDTERRRVARNIWNASLPIIDTPVTKYLDRRALPEEFVSQQENVRFARLSFDRSAKKHPALVGAARDVHGEVVGIQRVYLNEEGGKLADDCKRSLGTIRGTAIRLKGIEAPLNDPEHIHLCEGLEDGLSVARYYQEATVWATMGISNLGAVELPASCKTVTLAHDNDDAGVKAAQQAAERFIRRGLEVNLDPPPPAYKDWNEYLAGHEFAKYQWGTDLPWLPDEEPNPDDYAKYDVLPTYNDLVPHDAF